MVEQKTYDRTDLAVRWHQLSLKSFRYLLAVRAFEQKLDELAKLSDLELMALMEQEALL